MVRRNGVGPALGFSKCEAGKVVNSIDECERTSSRTPNSKQAAIRAELAWSDTATALGIVARSNSPVITLCRMLLEAGCDPATPLEAWRASTLSLRIRSIGEAAKLRVNPKGTAFIKAVFAVPTAPPIRPNGRGAV